MAWDDYRSGRMPNSEFGRFMVNFKNVITGDRVFFAPNSRQMQEVQDEVLVKQKEFGAAIRF